MNITYRVRRGIATSGHGDDTISSAPGKESTIGVDVKYADGSLTTKRSVRGSEIAVDFSPKLRAMGSGRRFFAVLH
jgi:hypothetical protein